MTETPHRHVVLHDGTRILVRPVEPGDRERLVRGLEQLSERSRYLRFHHVVRHLSDEQLRYFTDVDHHDHEAWVALDEDRPDVPGAGVARYIRVTDEPEVAEAALTVADAYQGRGLGTLLLGILTASAIDNDISCFRNYVLEENAAMLGVFEELGARFHPSVDGVHRVDLPLPDDPDQLPDTAVGRTFRQISRTSELALDPPVWIEDHGDAPPAPVRTSGHERGPLQDWLDDALDQIT